mmetsp:Transcript_7844/g.25663  ORF Transcript_7844/g.25663 Transcript_7844/m.25663 type:complete len:234 (-) Transcript_7844:1840-2541(-)
MRTRPCGSLCATMEHARGLSSRRTSRGGRASNAESVGTTTWIATSGRMLGRPTRTACSSSCISTLAIAGLTFPSSCRGAPTTPLRTTGTVRSGEATTSATCLWTGSCRAPSRMACQQFHRSTAPWLSSTRAPSHPWKLPRSTTFSALARARRSPSWCSTRSQRVPCPPAWPPGTASRRCLPCCAPRPLTSCSTRRSGSKTSSACPETTARPTSLAPSCQSRRSPSPRRPWAAR